MNEIAMLNEYVAWLIRNSYKDSGLTGSKFDCGVFSLLINAQNLESGQDCLPDSVAGFNVLCGDNLSSEFLVMLIYKPEDSSKDVKRFLRSFYELQILYDFNYSDVWRKECGI